MFWQHAMRTHMCTTLQCRVCARLLEQKLLEMRKKRKKRSDAGDTLCSLWWEHWPYCICCCCCSDHPFVYPLKDSLLFLPSWPSPLFCSLSALLFVHFIHSLRLFLLSHKVCSVQAEPEQVTAVGQCSHTLPFSFSPLLQKPFSLSTVTPFNKLKFSNRINLHYLLNYLRQGKATRC